MFKKKIEEINKYDRRMNKYIGRMHEISKELEAAVQDVIIKKEVIDLYPSGADQQKTKVDLQTAKNKLICIIAEYDSTLNEIKKYYIVNKDNFVEYANWYPSMLSDSHKMVEIFYRNFIRNRQKINERICFRSFLIVKFRRTTSKTILKKYLILYKKYGNI